MINDNGSEGTVLKPLSPITKLINDASVADVVMLMVMLGNQEISPSVEIPEIDPLVLGKNN